MATIMVNPSTGADEAFIMSLASGEPIGKVKKGNVLKVTSSTSDAYVVKYQDDTIKTARGGNEFTGMVMAYPSAPLYEDNKRKVVLGNVNNGTQIEILDDTVATLYKIKARTEHGVAEGYMLARYITRDGEYDFSAAEEEVEPEPEVETPEEEGDEVNA